MYPHAKRSHMHLKDHVVHVRVWWVMETPKQSSMYWKCQTQSLHSAEVGHYTEKEETLDLNLKSKSTQSRFVQEYFYSSWLRNRSTEQFCSSCGSNTVNSKTEGLTVNLSIRRSESGLLCHANKEISVGPVTWQKTKNKIGAIDREQLTCIYGLTQNQVSSFSRFYGEVRW